MSKAFTKETDDLPERPRAPRPVSLPGGKDYLTPASAQQLREELERLMESVGSSESGSGVESQPAKQRIAELRQTLATAEIVPPPAQPWEQVLFGATVTVRDDAGTEWKYRIVGREETNLDRNWVSWTSPIARALLKARLGQQVHFRIPAGEQHWEIVAVDYE